MAEIKHQVPIEATPAKVYAALTTEKGLRSWWTADAMADEKVGGEAHFGFQKRQIVFHMKIEKLERDKKVVWKCHGDNPEWKGTTLTWNIARQDGETVLRFSHSGWKSVSEMFAICNSSWGELMFRIKNYVEGRKPGPHWRH